MASRYAALRTNATIGSAKTTRLCDFDETDRYYFVVRENKDVIAEGELIRVKLKLDESYLKRPIKSFSRDQTTMIANISY